MDDMKQEPAYQKSKTEKDHDGPKGYPNDLEKPFFSGNGRPT